MKNNIGNTSYIFKENGSFICEFEDALGNKGTAKVDWIDKTLLPPVKAIEPIGRYSNQVRIEKSMADGKILFAITSLTGEAPPEFDLFIPEYNEDEKLAAVRLGERTIIEDREILSADLSGLNQYKIMILGEAQTLLTEVIRDDTACV